MCLLDTQKRSWSSAALDEAVYIPVQRTRIDSSHKDHLQKVVADLDYAELLHMLENPNNKWFGYDVFASETMRRVVLKTSSALIMVNRISRLENLAGKEYDHPWEVSGRILRGKCLMEIVDPESHTSKFVRLKSGDVYYIAKGEKHSVFPITEELYTVSVRPYHVSSSTKFSRGDQIAPLSEDEINAFLKDVHRTLCSPEQYEEMKSAPLPVRIPEEFEASPADSDYALRYLPAPDKVIKLEQEARLLEWAEFCAIDFTGCRNS